MLLLWPHLREYPHPLVRSSAAMAAQAGRAAASLDVPLHSAPILNTHRDAYPVYGVSMAVRIQNGWGVRRDI